MPAPLIHHLIPFKRRHPHKRVHPARKRGLWIWHAQAHCSHANVKHLESRKLTRQVKIWKRCFQMGTRERSAHHGRYLCGAWLAERLR